MKTAEIGITPPPRRRSLCPETSTATHYTPWYPTVGPRGTCIELAPVRADHAVNKDGDKKMATRASIKEKRSSRRRRRRRRPISASRLMGLKTGARQRQ